MGTSYNVIGLMSGTSMDGLDIAYCRFDLVDGIWQFKIQEATTIEYSNDLIRKFQKAQDMPARQLALLDVDYGHFTGQTVKIFMDRHKIKADIICSHGQTIMHQPEQRLTLQIGNGAAIAAETGTTVVCDFRSSDVALGGQGAPLVPIGDELLFGNFDACLNIGGFANISYKAGNSRIAYDICPANIILNFLTKRFQDKLYDADGQIAASGHVSAELLGTLNNLPYYKLPAPKSLGNEWVEEFFLPLINESELKGEDLLRTFTEHIAVQIANSIRKCRSSNTLASGGGVHNKFLVKCINDLSDNGLVMPSKELIDYKEALIFAFLGVLRMRNEINCLKSVTGASRDNCGGAVYWGK